MVFLKLEAPWTNHLMIFMLCFVMHSPQMNQRAKCNCCCEIIKHEVVCLELNLHKTKDGGEVYDDSNNRWVYRGAGFSETAEQNTASWAWIIKAVSGDSINFKRKKKSCLIFSWVLWSELCLGAISELFPQNSLVILCSLLVLCLPLSERCVL